MHVNAHTWKCKFEYRVEWYSLTATTGHLGQQELQNLLLEYLFVKYDSTSIIGCA